MAKGPAPKGEYSGKSSVFSTRITPDLKDRLDAAAQTSGRSVSQEVEHRLRRSFVEDDRIADAFGDRRTYRLMRMIADAIHMSQRSPSPTPSDEWLENPYQSDIAVSAARHVLDAVQPSGPALNDDVASATEALGAGIAAKVWLEVNNAAASIDLAQGSFKDHLNAVAKNDIGDRLLERVLPAIRASFYRVLGNRYPSLMEDIMQDVQEEYQKAERDK